VSILGVALVGATGCSQGHDDLPSPEVALAVARGEWSGHSYCADREQAWPCFVVTGIELDSTAPSQVKHVRYYGNGLGYCFDIGYQIEITAWNPYKGVPSEPRQYVAADKPARQCARFSSWDGDKGDASSWALQMADDPWFYAVDHLRDVLCERANNCSMY
jgi:hypothetical protein